MRPDSTSPSGNRREFLRGGLRTAAFAVLGALTALLVARRQTRLPGQTCVNQGVCSTCGSFSGCGLPQALSAKQALGSTAIAQD